VEHSINRVGSMLTLFFNGRRVVDWDTASKSDTKRFSRYFWGLIDRGVYMPCSQYEALFISAAHTEQDIAATIAAAQAAIR
jgi:glutamate-1-semialdehyde 2,1-aminomutase